MNSYFFIEEQSYLKAEIPETFIFRQYFEPVSVNNLFKSKVTGLSIIDENIYFFLPKNTQDILSDDFKKKIGEVTFNSILKYRNENQLGSEEKYWLGKDNSNAELVDTIKWLINDYKNHGIYSEEITYQSKELNGRIQWSKTIKSQPPFVIDEQIFYPNLISVSRKINTNSLLTAIHNKVMSEITTQYGWLFQVDQKTELVKLDLSNQQIIQYLKKELNQTTNTRNQLLIINLLKYLVESVLKNKTFDLVTPYFEYVWEDALKIIFDDNELYHQLVGKPYWKFSDGTVKTSVQLPDILTSLDSTLLILDAKYYSMNENFTSNAPGWNSVVKQLYYNLSMQLEFSEIQNMFLIPDISVKNELYNYVGLASVNDYEEDFGVVYAFRINTEYVLSSYLNEISRKNLLNELLEKIKSKS